ncbi:hypothetical protein KKA33_02845 [Patescibacteria group bacterium]|nr:hypothetical protein [Patescibacteria group bacterium]
MPFPFGYAQGMLSFPRKPQNEGVCMRIYKEILTAKVLTYFKKCETM